MTVKKFACLLTACAMAGVLAASPVQAAGILNEEAKLQQDVMPCATSSLSFDIPANTKATVGNEFTLAAGETVTFKGSYSPFTAELYIGLLSSDGVFYYEIATNGSIDKTIRVSKSGTYKLQFRNTSNTAVTLTGSVNY